MRWLCCVFAVFSAFLFTATSKAQEFVVITEPSFAAIQAREVYGILKYDFKFTGNDPSTRSQNAMEFLKSQMDLKFSNREGNYIVTLELSVNGTKVASEPIISASWKTNKFLFVTTSEQSNIVVNRNGVLLDRIVIDPTTNRVQLSLRILKSESTAVDMSWFKELADLSKTATMSAFAPGLAGVTEAFQPLTGIFAKLLERYRNVSIVDNTFAAFTLLDSGFANQLQYRTNKFTANIFLQTIPSQLSSSFENGKFKPVNPNLAILEVKSGVGAARAPILDIIQARPGDDVADFVAKVRSFRPYGTAPQAQTDIGDKCALLRTQIDKLASLRDSALLYWAFVMNYRGELLEYRDGKRCALDPSLTNDFAGLGLISPADWP